MEKDDAMDWWAVALTRGVGHEIGEGEVKNESVGERDGMSSDD
jgi:hypothetical protein